jgi:hypothetical protein
MIRLLTGPVDGGRGGASRGAMSVRSLSNEDCVLSNMIEELIQLAEKAMQVCGVRTRPCKSVGGGLCQCA